MASRRTQRAELVVTEIEAVEKPGMGIDEAIVLTTFFLLAIAIAIVVLANQSFA